MHGDWFIEIKELQFEGDGGAKLPAGVRESLEPWLPASMGVLASMHNYDEAAPTFDYIIVADQLVYFVILFNDGDKVELRSVKTFRMDHFYAIGHMLHPCPGEAAEDFPHVRLLMRDGKRIKLAFRQEGAVLEKRLQQLGQSTFFR